MKNFQKDMLDRFEQIYEVSLHVEMATGNNARESFAIALKLYELGNTPGGLYQTFEMVDEAKKKK